mgnify:CR=1 FL=1
MLLLIVPLHYTLLTSPLKISPDLAITVELEIDFDYSNLPTNILSGDSMKKSLEGPSLLPPPPLPEPDYTPIYIAVGIGGIFFIGVIFFIKISRFFIIVQSELFVKTKFLLAPDLKNIL